MTTTTTTTTTTASPSAARRQALREASSDVVVYKVIESFPIESYFDLLTKRLLREFECAVDRRDLDAAYIYGLRFATFSLEVLPKHKGYKNAPQLRQINAKQVEQVLSALEDVTARMDAEEVVAERQRRQRVQQEEVEKAAAAAAREEEEKVWRRQQQQQVQEEEAGKQRALHRAKETRQESIQKSAMAKLLALQQQSFRDVPTTTTTGSTSSTSTPQPPHQHQPQQLPPQKEKQPVPRLAQQRTTSSRSPNRARSKTEPTRTSSSTAAAGQRSALDSLPSLTMVDTLSSSQNYHDERNKPSSSSSSSTDSFMSDCLCPDEQRTIRLLETAIARQEARWPALQHTADQLRIEAKECLAQTNRTGALGKLAQRQRVLKAVQTAKTSIFTMQTQMMRIENAASDRDVQAAMRKASDTMAALRSGVVPGHKNGDDVVTSVQEEFVELGEVNHVLAHTDLLVDSAYNDEELLNELLGDDENEKKEQQPDEVTSGLLSLPSLPHNSPMRTAAAAAASKAQERKQQQPIMATIV